MSCCLCCKKTEDFFSKFPTVCLSAFSVLKVCKGAKIRNQYNQAPHLTQDTNGKVTNSQLDTTNEPWNGQ